MTFMTLFGWSVMNTLTKFKARKKLLEDSKAAEIAARPQGLPV
jgi:hypothetical protein